MITGQSVYLGSTSAYFSVETDSGRFGVTYPEQPSTRPAASSQTLARAAGVLAGHTAVAVTTGGSGAGAPGASGQPGTVNPGTPGTSAPGTPAPETPTPGIGDPGTPQTPPPSTPPDPVTPPSGLVPNGGTQPGGGQRFSIMDKLTATARTVTEPVGRVAAPVLQPVTDVVGTALGE